MKFNIGHFFRAVLLAAFGLLIIKLHMTDEIFYYINPKYKLLSQSAAVIFILFFFVQLFRVWEKTDVHSCECLHDCGHDHDHGHEGSLPKKIINYGIILFPIMTGFTMAPAVLDASIAEKKGVMLQGQSLQEGKDNAPEINQAIEGQQNSDRGVVEEKDENELADEIEEIVPSSDFTNEVYDDGVALPNNNYLTEEQYQAKLAELENEKTIVMDEALFEPYYEKISMNPKAYEGKTIKLAGFIYREEGFTENQLVVSRFLITHCVADASIIGFLTEFDIDVQQIDANAWLEIEGELRVGQYNDIELPIIRVTHWQIIDQPSEPYVYPVLTKVIG